MPQGNPRAGELYLHFKKKMYQVITVAQHSETGEKLVIYQALYGNYKTYARPFEMFISPVDTEKYPQADQRFRFQLVEAEEMPARATEELTRKMPAGMSEKAAEEMPVRVPEEAASQKNAELQDVSEEAASQKNAELQDTPEEKMMAFFDADTIEKKYKILLTMSDCITNHMINNMAVVLDLVIEDGPVEKRFEELKGCLRTMQQYESTRLR